MIHNLLVVSAVAAAALSVGAAPASAGCYGTENTVLVCVDPTGTTLWSDCVHLGTEPCTPVEVPGPVVDCSFPDDVERVVSFLNTFEIRNVDCVV